MTLHPAIARATSRIAERSRAPRQRYLDLIRRARDGGSQRRTMSCANLAHGVAAAGEDKRSLTAAAAMNIAIVTAYNDMLSAHQPYGRYPETIKLFAREAGCTAQVAGGVPAMCDGITQGRAGMDLSLFSRDTIALSTAIALSHGMFEGAALLGICDKIVPGLLIGALRFGHLPAVFVPAGPMPSGLPNKDKQRIRQLHAEGKADGQALFAAESASYHSPGTCTFYGTANTNQMMMELMGLHVPGAAFVAPGTPLRQALTRAAIQRLARIGWDGNDYRPLGLCVDERAIVNAAVGLLATGGSTNHTIHLPAMARAAGVLFEWDDLDAISSAVPLIARIYPNGSADVNAFHACGGMARVVAELLEAGLVHGDVMTAGADGLAEYATAPALQDGHLEWSQAAAADPDSPCLRPIAKPFAEDGGLRVLTGNLGRAIFKTSAVDPSRWRVEAQARIFCDQESVKAAFRSGTLDRDVVVVVRFQGPKANGMPELHELMPILGVLQARGHAVALLSDGRLSGASGSVPAAIHLTPEAAAGGGLAKLRDGDVVRIDAHRGTLTAEIDEAEWTARPPVRHVRIDDADAGRELFALFRAQVDGADRGASPILAAAML
ncbi:MAG TPA: phosphogluconate dehydratase [Rhizomicrobium sp.]|nr:phosphogluconate dehydratase [Rhizomicrobium sp.]